MQPDQGLTQPATQDSAVGCASQRDDILSPNNGSNAMIVIRGEHGRDDCRGGGVKIGSLIHGPAECRDQLA